MHRVAKVRRTRPGAAKAKPQKWSAPVAGWRTDVPIGDMPPTAASLLLNWFPEPGYLRARNGSYTYATGLGSQVNTIIPYSGNDPVSGAPVLRLYAAAGTNIFDVSGGGAVGAAAVSAVTHDHWSYAQLSSAGGKFLTIVNGFDQARQFNGSAWSIPAFTGVDTSTLNIVTLYKSRLYFIQKNSTYLYYGTTYGVAGALTQLDVGANMSYGGSLIALGIWTQQVYNGLLQFLVVVTSEGEVLFYQGSNPGDSTNWSLLGTAKLSAPLGGDRCVRQIGGDLAIMTTDGVVPASQAIVLDPAATDIKSLTAHITPTWLETVQDVPPATAGWQFMTFAARRMAIVHVPDPAGVYQFVMNTETQAWTKFSGLNATCWGVWEGGLYFGDTGGNVWQAEYGSIDGTSPIDCQGVGAWARGDGITQNMPTIITIDANMASYGALYGSVSVDYTYNLPLAVATAGSSTIPAEWGIADWGIATWPGPASVRLIAPANAGSGIAMAPTFRAVISGSESEASNCFIFGGAYLYEPGNFI